MYAVCLQAEMCNSVWKRPDVSYVRMAQENLEVVQKRAQKILAASELAIDPGIYKISAGRCGKTHQVDVRRNDRERCNDADIARFRPPTIQQNIDTIDTQHGADAFRVRVVPIQREEEHVVAVPILKRLQHG